MRKLWRITWRCLLFLIVWGALLAPAVVPVSATLVQIYFDGVSLLTLAAATALMLHFVEHRRFVTVGFERHRAWRDLLCGVAIGAAWLIISIGAAWSAGWVSLATPAGFSWSVFAGATAALALNTVMQEL